MSVSQDWWNNHMQDTDELVRLIDAFLIDIDWGIKVYPSCPKGSNVDCIFLIGHCIVYRHGASRFCKLDIVENANILDNQLWQDVVYTWLKALKDTWRERYEDD